MSSSGNITDWGSNFIAELFIGRNALPTIFYVALLNAAPGPSTDGTLISAAEPSVLSGYARQTLSAPSNFTAASGGVVVNNVALTFAVAAEDYGVISHYALCTAGSAGNVYGYGAFSSPAGVSTGQQFIIDAGNIVLALSGPLTSL